jgi:hypothetical protein
VDDSSAEDDGKGAGAGGACSSGLGAGWGGVVGGERQPSSCGICLFFARTAARLLDLVASLIFFARLLGGGAGCDGSSSSGGAGCGDWKSGGAVGAGCSDVSRIVVDGVVVTGETACPAVAGSAVADSSSGMDVVWRRGCEQWSLLTAHASLLLLSRARLLSLAWRPGLRCSGGAATVGAGWMLRMRVSFSSTPRVSYNTLA